MISLASLLLLDNSVWQDSRLYLLSCLVPKFRPRQGPFYLSGIVSGGQKERIHLFKWISKWDKMWMLFLLQEKVLSSIVYWRVSLIPCFQQTVLLWSWIPMSYGEMKVMNCTYFYLVFFLSYHFHVKIIHLCPVKNASSSEDEMNDKSSLPFPWSHSLILNSFLCVLPEKICAYTGLYQCSWVDIFAQWHLMIYWWYLNSLP